MEFTYVHMCACVLCVRAPGGHHLGVHVSGSARIVYHCI